MMNCQKRLIQRKSARQHSSKGQSYKEPSSNEKGAALIVGLIFLVVMSIMGLSSIKNVTVQERVTGHSLDSFRAAQSAEIALLVAESNVQFDDFSTDNKFFNSDTTEIDFDDADLDLWSNCGDDSVASNKLCEIVNINAHAKYQATEAQDTFRITVRGYGVGNSKVILQSKYQGKIKEQD